VTIHAWAAAFAVSFALACSPSNTHAPLMLVAHDEAGAYDGSPAGSDGSWADAVIGDAAARDADASDDAFAPDDVENDAARDGGTDGTVPGVTIPPSVCSPAVLWGSGTSLGLAIEAGAALGAVTPDELTIAWTYSTAAGIAVAWADRASSADPFGATQTAAGGYFADDRVALSPDGLRLVVVDADRQGFSELTRSTRTGAGNAFMDASSGSYVNFAAAGLTAGQSLGDPVLSASDTAFYYSVYDGVQSATIYQSLRLLPGDPWPVGAVLSDAPQLAANGSVRRRPTAISSDEQTLFFWDEAVAMERATWVDPLSGAFDTFVDLGTRSGAGPNATCTRLYYAAATDSGAADLLFAAP
jgi:hypothetical protein